MPHSPPSLQELTEAYFRSKNRRERNKLFRDIYIGLSVKAEYTSAKFFKGEADAKAQREDAIAHAFKELYEKMEEVRKSQEAHLPSVEGFFVKTLKNYLIDLYRKKNSTVTLNNDLSNRTDTETTDRLKVESTEISMPLIAIASCFPKKERVLSLVLFEALVEYRLVESRKDKSRHYKPAKITEVIKRYPELAKHRVYDFIKRHLPVVQKRIRLAKGREAMADKLDWLLDEGEPPPPQKEEALCAVAKLLPRERDHELEQQRSDLRKELREQLNWWREVYQKFFKKQDA